jgi:CelD/BcsL family acetyltransferase involved in cellulose biosynthesis
VFQSFEWQRTWWRHFGEGRPAARLHLVALRDPRGLVAVAPLYVDATRALGVLPLRRLLFVGHRDSDYLDLLVERGRERECTELVAAQLTADRERLDAIVLEDTPDRSRAAPLLGDALARRGWTTSRTPGECCPRTTLRATWEDTLAAFRRHTRHEIRRRSRGLAAGHRVELEVVTGGPAVAPGVNELVELHQARWVRDGSWGVFSDRRRAAFLVDVAGPLSRRRWLYLAFLRVDGRRAAASLGFTFGDALAVYFTGARHDPDLARFSPSRILHARSMEWAIGAGRTVYDFMRGGERYKRDAFDALDVPNWTLVAYPRRPALVRWRHRLHAAAGRARRRAWREAYALGVATRGGGAAALGMHLARAARRIGADLRRALRPPRPR